MPNYNQFAKIEWTMWVLLVINTFLFIGAIYQIISMFKVLRCADHLMIQNIFFIALTLFLKDLYYFGFVVYFRGYEIFPYTYYYDICLLFSDVFYILPVNLTISKWLNFKISAQAQVDLDFETFRKKNKMITLATYCINIIVIVFTVIITALMISYTNEGKNYLQIFDIFILILYGIALIGLIFASTTLIKTLKQSYIDFYNQEKKLLLFMMIVTIVALSSRIIFQLVEFIQNDIIQINLDLNLEQNQWELPLYLVFDYILTNFIPFGALQFSFWYGISRRTKVVLRQRNLSSKTQSKTVSGDEDFSPSDWQQGDHYQSDNFNPFQMNNLAKQATSMTGRTSYTSNRGQSFSNQAFPEFYEQINESGDTQYMPMITPPNYRKKITIQRS